MTAQKAAGNAGRLQIRHTGSRTSRLRGLGTDVLYLTGTELDGRQYERDEADVLDRERAATGPRGPLHGIPVLVKDNYDTADMPTSGGTLGLATMQPSMDAFQVRRLREAGAVILGKTTMHELAAGITTISSLTDSVRGAVWTVSTRRRG